MHTATKHRISLLTCIEIPVWASNKSPPTVSCAVLCRVLYTDPDQGTFSQRPQQRMKWKFTYKEFSLPILMPYFPPRDPWNACLREACRLTAGLYLAPWFHYITVSDSLENFSEVRPWDHKSLKLFPINSYWILCLSARSARETCEVIKYFLIPSFDSQVPWKYYLRRCSTEAHFNTISANRQHSNLPVELIPVELYPS